MLTHACVSDGSMDDDDLLPELDALIADGELVVEVVLE